MSIIHSMTGSASKLVNSQLANINIDISSVNGRYLEIYLKLPDNLRHLDSKLRALCQEKLTRGKLDCYITYALNAQASLNIDANQLEALSEALNQVEKTIPNACNLNPMEILQYPGILKQPANIQDLIDEQVLENFAKALDSLVKTRESEGEKLKQALQVRLDLIEKQADLIEVQLTNLTKIEREKILKKIEDLKIEIDPQRIEQEVAIIAQKADVEEEYDRLRAHIKEVRAILDKGGICGKRLDFMMQEFNRESNTLASKASNLDITRIAVELKVLIEQMREQVQNIE
ncbi:MAG: YicC/YloC family endoribonuclease [Succinivibrio sp.]|nr:YicC family protein [Succinivibrio sp.]MDY4992398.1 YicC/YloC family endoribonuclease [Succinivibrio sp.]MDY5324942.1 YicC/YloC family endoribonuclease [Succinivibrio sp.]MDY5904707.1 YicC/YloC family endoribonuclease [Succinivibrio sp.]MEE0891974.1 YicC/YloC family endoribonuclease [Succinivibrio sp.]